MGKCVILKECASFPVISQYFPGRMTRDTFVTDLTSPVTQPHTHCHIPAPSSHLCSDLSVVATLQHSSVILGLCQMNFVNLFNTFSFNCLPEQCRYDSSSYDDPLEACFIWLMYCEEDNNSTQIICSIKKLWFVRSFHHYCCLTRMYPGHSLWYNSPEIRA